jgi:hypothetical protein
MDETSTRCEIEPTRRYIIAKESGRNAYRFFSNQMSADSIARTEMQLQLREALERGEFYLCYQPQICLRHGRITALEALLRWQRSEFDTILPDTFIPIAEKSGLIIPIGDWALNEACRQAAAWRAAGFADLIVAVNLSALQIRRGNLASVVTAALERSGLPAASLELELSEKILLQDTELTDPNYAASSAHNRCPVGDRRFWHRILQPLVLEAAGRKQTQNRAFVYSNPERKRKRRGDRESDHPARQYNAARSRGRRSRNRRSAGVSQRQRLRSAQGSLFSMPVCAADVPRSKSADVTPR